jgi:hypothetical protein
MECRSGSLRLDAGRPDHLGPLFCFVADEFLEFGGRHRHRHRGQIGETRSEFWIGESGAALFIKFIDDPWPPLSFTTKAAPVSSIDQGGGKRPAIIVTHLSPSHHWLGAAVTVARALYGSVISSPYLAGAGAARRYRRDVLPR